MPRIKATPASFLTQADIEALVGKVADLEFTRQQLSADAADVQRALDRDIAILRDRWQPHLDHKAETLAALDKSISATIDQIENWAKVNPQRFTARRSLELTRGTIGFRLSPPSIKTLKGWTQRLSAAALAKLPWGSRYLAAPALDKEALLKDRANLQAADLAQAGLLVEQADAFYVEPKHESTDSLAGRMVA